jgi:hypothetical protein
VLQQWQQQQQLLQLQAGRLSTSQTATNKVLCLTGCPLKDALSCSVRDDMPVHSCSVRDAMHAQVAAAAAAAAAVNSTPLQLLKPISMKNQEPLGLQAMGNANALLPEIFMQFCTL